MDFWNYVFIFTNNKMRQQETLWQSVLKGVVLSLFLIGIHIACSGSSSEDKHVKIIKFENSSDFPVDTKEAANFSVRTFSLPAVGYIEICREALCIFEILFSVENSNHYEIRVPLPLLSYLRILFTSAISVNAP
jgi:hypothetical protein